MTTNLGTAISAAIQQAEVPHNRCFFLDDQLGFSAGHKQKPAAGCRFPDEPITCIIHPICRLPGRSLVVHLRGNLSE